jgi:glutathione S-transferase
VLNYKQIPYRTEWIESQTIGPIAKRVGAPPTARTPRGTPIYTAPFIFCPRTRTYISDSLEIALHVDRRYTTTTANANGRLFPEGQEALIRVWNEMWVDRVVKPIFPYMLVRVYEQLTPGSANAFRMAYERRFKGTLESLASEDNWTSFRHGLTYFASLYPSAEARFVGGGEEPTYADFVVAGWMVWLKRVLGEESEKWREVAEADGGRWGGVVRTFGRWEYTDETARTRCVGFRA